MLKRRMSPFIEILEKEAFSGLTFNKLMHKMFAHNSQLYGYKFKPNPKYRNLGNLEIDGLVEDGYPEVEGTVLFQFKELRVEGLKGSIAYQMEQLLKDLVDSQAVFNRFILVTPEDLRPDGETLLYKYRKEYGFDLVHYGETEILKLLVDIPAFNKYFYDFYGKNEDAVLNFKSYKQEYEESVLREVQNLPFLGLPTAQYQRPMTFRKVRLKDVYIPLKLETTKGEMREVTLTEAKKNNTRFVVLGGPGSGKSTLSKFLAMDSLESEDAELENWIPPKIKKIPFTINLCEFVVTAEKKSRELDFLSYLHYDAENRLNREIDPDFILAMLELGKAIVIFDGLDEVLSDGWRNEIVGNIKKFSDFYSDCPIWVMSRAFGYSRTRGLNPKIFRHYNLSRVSVEQSVKFIDQFYKNQLNQAGEDEYREEKIASFHQIFDKSPDMAWFRGSPLYLTLIAILNLNAFDIPKNRSELYKKFLELALWTWPNQKESEESQNTLVEKGIDYYEQLRLMGNIAAFMKNQGKRTDFQGTDEIISQEEVEKLVAQDLMELRKMPKENADDVAQFFFKYMVNQTGFLLPKRKEKGEKEAYAFVHHSFLEYLYAFHTAQDRLKTDTEHINHVVRHLEDMEWGEIILFSLLILSEHMGQDFFKSFSKTALEALTPGGSLAAWGTLGRALRDNIPLDENFSKRICSELLKRWLTDKEKNQLAHSVMRQIALYSKRGKNILKEVISASIIQSETPKAIASLSLTKHFYGIDDSSVEAVDSNIQRESLLPYLPVYRDEPTLLRYIEKNLKPSHWAGFYNSAKSKPLEILENIIQDKMNDSHLKGYLASSWATIFDAFNKRKCFIDTIKNDSGRDYLMNQLETQYNFLSTGNWMEKISNPLTIFRSYLPNPPAIHFSKIDDDRFFELEDKRDSNVDKQNKYIEYWAINLLLKLFSSIKKKFTVLTHFIEEDREQIVAKSTSFGNRYSSSIAGYFNHSFFKDLEDYFLKAWESDDEKSYLVQSFGSYIKAHEKVFKKSFNEWDFNQEFMRNLNQWLSKDFCFYFGRIAVTKICENMIRQFGEFLLEKEERKNRSSQKSYRSASAPNLKKQILDKYIRPHLENSKWKEWEDIDFRMFQNLVVGIFDEPNERNWPFISFFYAFQYEYFFKKSLEISFENFSSGGRYSNETIFTLPNIHFSINSPFIIPFIFNFILSGDLNHYLIKLLVELNTKFYNKRGIEWQNISRALRDYTSKHPFIYYFVNHSWELYCKNFYSQFSRCTSPNLLRLAVLITEAAKISMLTEQPCYGVHWDKLLEIAQNSRNTFVKIALSLYNLCNFNQKIKESQNLIELLEELAEQEPEQYNLIGFAPGLKIKDL